MAEPDGSGNVGFDHPSTLPTPPAHARLCGWAHNELVAEPAVSPSPASAGVPGTVRVATMADMERIGEINAAAWQARLPGLLLQTLLDSLRPSDLALVWAGALINPPTAEHRLLVAIAATGIAGYAAIGPSADPDADPTTGELLALEVDPGHWREGHGSRLMVAAVETSRALGRESLTAWCPVLDEVRRSFLQSAGWAPDTAVRDLAVAESQTLREVRLVTDIRDSADRQG